MKEKQFIYGECGLVNSVKCGHKLRLRSTRRRGAYIFSLHFPSPAAMLEKLEDGLMDLRARLETLYPVVITHGSVPELEAYVGAMTRINSMLSMCFGSDKLAGQHVQPVRLSFHDSTVVLSFGST